MGTQEEVAKYLKEIVPPVLACFSDQDARVRYYACEAMYNIAKVAKGEILLFFNDVFDALCKVRVEVRHGERCNTDKCDSWPLMASSRSRTAPSSWIDSSRTLCRSLPQPTSRSSIHRMSISQTKTQPKLPQIPRRSSYQPHSPSPDSYLSCRSVSGF